MKKKGKAKKIIITLLILILTVLILLSMSVALYIKRVVSKELDLSLFSIDTLHTATKIFVMQDGEWVEWEEERILGEEHFEYVSFNDVPTHLANAFVAIEDKRFYEHSGVDWYRTLGAMANYFLHFGGRFGASTITQQLIKNITGEDEVSIERKIREISHSITRRSREIPPRRSGLRSVSS